MGPAFVVVPDIFSQHPAQMGFVEDDDSIQVKWSFRRETALALL